MTLNRENSKSHIQKEMKYFAQTGRIKYCDIVFVNGKGAKLYDKDGNEYVDLLASASAINVGHCHEKVVKAVKDQCEKLIHYTPAYFSHPLVYSLQKKLVQLTPGNFPKKVLFGNSGSDANDGMIKYARAYTKRPYIVTFTDAYHGSTYGSLTESAVSLNMRKMMGPFVGGIYQLPFPDMYRRLKGESDEDLTERYLDNFRLAFRTYLPADEVAAVLVEPIQGDGGIRTVPKAFFQKLYALCKENGILFMVDEINQGLGRSGKMWSIEHFGIEPDLLATAKSLASGMPLSAIIGRAEIMDSLPAPAHLFTTSGNPVCCAASLATLDVILEEDLVEKSRSEGEYVKKRFKEMQEKYECIGDVRVFGLNAGIELVTDRKTKTKNSDCANKIIYYLFDHGVVMITLGGNTLRFQPPLVIKKEELDFALSTIDDAFKAYEEGKLTTPADRHIGW